METITQREFRNNSASVMDGVQNGTTYIITRNGEEVAELSPRRKRVKITTAELIEKMRHLPPLDSAQLRKDAEDFFADDDEFDSRDPWETANGE